MQVSHRSRARRKLAAAARRAAASLPKALPPVLFLTDKERTPDPGAVAARLPRGWGVVLRTRHMRGSTSLAAELARICRGRGLVFLVSAAPDLARAVGAHGVHWPERLAAQSRRWAGAFPLMTASAHSRAGLARLAALPVDAALRSVVFPSQSRSAGAAMGPVRFRLDAARAPIPVYALGGLGAANAGRIAGAAGLAAIDGVAAAYDGLA